MDHSQLRAVPLGERAEANSVSLHPGEWQAGFIVKLTFTFSVLLCKIKVWQRCDLKKS